MSKESASDLLTTPSSQYVIAMTGEYVFRMLGSDDVTGDALLQSAYLRSKQTKVQVHALRVARERTSFPVVVFHFPKKSERYPVIRAADKEIEFHWTLGKNHVQTIFDLRK